MNSMGQSSNRDESAAAKPFRKGDRVIEKLRGAGYTTEEESVIAFVRKGIAYTFQITSIFGKLTVFDNVALSVQRALLSDGGLAMASLRHGVMEALERTGLAGRAHETAGNLAYGHQRLLEVAMGLALKPRLLILDEPTQGLSDGEIEGFVTLVRRIAEDATVLLIEHNMPLVMELAQTITVFERGSILAEGTPAEIRDNPAVQDAYLGAAADG